MKKIKSFHCGYEKPKQGGITEGIKDDLKGVHGLRHMVIIGYWENAKNTKFGHFCYF